MTFSRFLVVSGAGPMAPGGAPDRAPVTARRSSSGKRENLRELIAAGSVRLVQGSAHDRPDRSDATSRRRVSSSPNRTESAAGSSNAT
jgi:hypothetical protein